MIKSCYCCRKTFATSLQSQFMSSRVCKLRGHVPCTALRLVLCGHTLSHLLWSQDKMFGLAGPTFSRSKTSLALCVSLLRVVRSIRKLCLRSSGARAELVSTVASYNTAGSVHCGHRDLSCSDMDLSQVWPAVLHNTWANRPSRSNSRNMENISAEDCLNDCIGINSIPHGPSSLLATPDRGCLHSEALVYLNYHSLNHPRADCRLHFFEMPFL